MMHMRRRSVAYIIGYTIFALGVLLLGYVLLATISSDTKIITPVVDYGGIRVIYITPSPTQ